jgi:hypothetical protein
MIDMKAIQKHAENAADEGKEKDTCPCDINSPLGEFWLDHFFRRVMWLSGESTI